MFGLCVAGYSLSGGSWPLFFLLILAPDLSMLGYLAGPRIGAYAYNLFHTLIMPLCLLAFGFLAGQDLAMQISAIWLAHIAIDRALGYGLKFSTGFQDTHLGRIGRDKPVNP
ncbi:DUF4260 domain-containing protein [Mesorhizobium sp. WSM2239]|uniref:DUF4260 domain-containing protein n=2 Tax=unclassified Mesorhizobium TaxID=325217 RepID=A0AAU8D896_9HYPH